MFANTKQFKQKIKQLHLPWWFNLVKWGIPYLLATITTLIVIGALGGWMAIPEGIQLLQWAVALFSAMQPVVKFAALSLMALGSFLSTLLMSSVFVRGILFYFAEKAAVGGEKVSADLFEQNKELQQDIHKAGELHQQAQEQLAFLKGFSTAKANRAYEGFGQEIQETRETEREEEAVMKPATEKPVSISLPNEAGPVLLFRKKSGELGFKKIQGKAPSISPVLQEEQGEQKSPLKT